MNKLNADVAHILLQLSAFIRVHQAKRAVKINFSASFRVFRGLVFDHGIRGITRKFKIYLFDNKIIYI